MLAEHLHYRVPPDQTAAFAAHNRRWRESLTRQPGFIDQSSFRREDDSTAWLVIVRWADRAALDAFPPALQRELDEAGRAFGALERAEFYLEVDA